MKKILSLISVFTLIVTSASSLQPIFTKFNVNNILKSNKSNKKITIKITNEISLLIKKINDTEKYYIVFSQNGNIYFGKKIDSLLVSINIIKKLLKIDEFHNFDKSWLKYKFIIYNYTQKLNIKNNQLMKSNDEIKFEPVTNVIPNQIWTIIIASNGIIWIGTEDDGLYIINSINSLLKITKPDIFDKSWPLYKCIFYNYAQKIDIKENLIASETLNRKSITTPTKKLDITFVKNTLILNLKNKELLNYFDEYVSTGQVTYKLWVKTSIDKNKIDYQTKINDTQLYSGLISNSGNKNGFDIIQTRSKKDTESHNAIINIDLNDDLIYDFGLNKDFYKELTVDKSNNFTEKSISQKKNSKNLQIATNDLYHLNLEDKIVNKYFSCLEIGESNWKLKGDFDDRELNKLKSKLNVHVNLNNQNQKSKALCWLHQYENFVDKNFLEIIKTNGKGFDSKINNQNTYYTEFLKLLRYEPEKEPKFTDGLDKNYLVKKITDKAKEILKNELNLLPQNLNVNTKNVVNKSTLNKYTSWINNYQKFININKNKLINDIANIDSRGFEIEKQKSQILHHIRNLNFKNCLEEATWTPNLPFNIFNYSDIINLINNTMKYISIAYKQAIKNAESGLNLHGYSIYNLLNGKQKPQTKSEIDKFDDEQSYHDWLQTQANIKFRGWQLSMGLGIAIGSLLGLPILGWLLKKLT